MASTLIPVRSNEQRLAALKRANVIRSTRAAWKRDVKAGRCDPWPTLIEPPAEFQTMRVYTALLALPAVGRSKAQEALKRAGVSPAKTLGGMTARQRSQLMALVRR